MGYASAVYYAAALALATPLQAQETRTGNAVLAECTSDDSGLRLSCVAWALGIAGGVRWAEIASDVKTVCYPAGATGGQFHDVILADLRARPQQRHLPADALAYAALRRAFPCPKK